ncbi:MAG: hypothetical protein MUC85_03850 [Anaerolineales bacterium]|jgi:DNA gyrase/topoisomerase IV subunit A|nr:hypothetical protein [Anaerolineales bacterium]
MITPEKIEQWIQEVQERPGSAPLIVQYIGSRLRDLAAHNEELLAENIALLNGKRVAEYEQRIAHLEYQLELLKRQLGGELPIESPAAVETLIEPLQLLIYNTRGQVLRLPIPAERLIHNTALAQLGDELELKGESARLLVCPASQELLLVFSSGRIFAVAVQNIPAVEAAGKSLSWQQAALPDEPRGTETLSYITPIASLALAEAFILVSRRGYLKKLKASMGQSILANHYLGSAASQSADRTLDLVLCASQDRLVLVSREGYLLCLETQALPYALEEGMRLASTDHLVSTFTQRPDHIILIMTQVGKLLYQNEKELACTDQLKTKGSPVFSVARRAQGVRVVAAAAAREQDWGLALHQDGRLTLHSVQAMMDAGKIPLESELAAFAFFASPGGM